MPAADHPVWKLVERLREFGEFPPGVRAIPESARVRGTAFFPAGFGLWNPDDSATPLPSRPLMVLGHNFGDVEALDDATRRAAEDLNGPTWRNLLRLLAEANVSPSRCFFTNALMGLKDDGAGCVGALTDDQQYRRNCEQFLEYQIQIMRPGCVLVLGADAQRVLIQINATVRAAWCGPRGGLAPLKRLYEAPGRALIPSVNFFGPLDCAAAAVYHPCELRNLRPVWNETVALVSWAAAFCGI